MKSRDGIMTPVLAGALFIILGALFGADALGYLVLDAAYLLPIALIGIGVAVLVGSTRRRPRPVEDTGPEPVTEERPGNAPAAGEADEPAASESGGEDVDGH